MPDVGVPAALQCLTLLLVAGCAGGFTGEYLDHEGRPAGASLTELIRHCDAAIGERLTRSVAGRRPFEAVAEPLAHVPTSKDERGLSIAYLVMVGRESAHYIVTRLVRSTYSAHNLYLLHLDAKLSVDAARPLRQALSPHGNIRFMARRHRVGWGAFSMVAVLLDGLATLVASSFPFDYVINLSDADMALRTHGEISTFLRQFSEQGASFVAVKEPSRDAMRYRSHAHMRRLPFVECGGLGFAVVNASAAELFGTGKGLCCLARSGPIVYARAPLQAARVPADIEVFHGSQWAILARPFVEHLAAAAVASVGAGAGMLAIGRETGDVQEDARAQGAARGGATNWSSATLPSEGRYIERLRSLIDGLAYSYLSDETFLQTALLDGPHPLRANAVSHNLRYIDWPVGQAGVAYWQRMGAQHASGPRVLDSSALETLRTSEAIFARKVDPTLHPSLIASWDELMERKLQGHHPADQPSIGASLLARDPNLAHLRPPRTRAERAACSPETAVATHAQHFGAEDILADLYSPRESQGESASAGAADGALPKAIARVHFADGSVCYCAGHCPQPGAASCGCAEHIPGCAQRAERGARASDVGEVHGAAISPDQPMRIVEQ
jgi:protein xylosyltransferase